MLLELTTMETELTHLNMSSKLLNYNLEYIAPIPYRVLYAPEISNSLRFDQS